uniref:Ig-like domain-containing protein n=1 Tax=Esox lucius TaxID=8010 RepID=A0AAY5L6M6_ESOLU
MLSLVICTLGKNIEYINSIYTTLIGWSTAVVANFSPGVPQTVHILIVALAKVRSGEKAQFNCSFDGQPFTEIVWDHNGKTLTDTERSVSYSLKHKGPLCCLNVKNIGPKQGGVYTCKIVNSAGDAECSTVMKGWQLHALDLTTSRHSWPLLAVLVNSTLHTAPNHSPFVSSLHVTLLPHCPLAKEKEAIE